MKKLALTAALGAACFGLAACNETETNNSADANASATGETSGMEPLDGNASGTAGGTGASATAKAGDWPRGTRIVEENGVTYRVNSDGARVRLDDVRIVTENGVRYRVRDGNRVRIDDQGIDIDVDVPDLTPDDVDVGVNKKGNLDIDVKNKKDGNSGPN